MLSARAVTSRQLMLAGGALAIAGFLIGAPAFARDSERAAPAFRTIRANGSETQYCKGPGGAWMPVRPKEAVTNAAPTTPATAPSPTPAAPPAPARQPTIFAPDFRGSVSYSGSYTGQIVVAPRAPRSLNVNDIMRSAMSGKTTEIGGTFSLELQYNGSSVQGSYRGTGRIGSDRIVGNRSGGVCTFQDRNSRWTAHCGPDGFFAKVASYQGVVPSVSANITSASTNIRDLGSQEGRQTMVSDAAQATNYAEQAGARNAGASAALNVLAPLQRGSPLASGLQSQNSGHASRASVTAPPGSHVVTYQGTVDSSGGIPVGLTLIVPDDQRDGEAPVSGTLAFGGVEQTFSGSRGGGYCILRLTKMLTNIVGYCGEKFTGSFSISRNEMGIPFGFHRFSMNATAPFREPLHNGKPGLPSRSSCTSGVWSVQNYSDGTVVVRCNDSDKHQVSATPGEIAEAQNAAKNDAIVNQLDAACRRGSGKSCYDLGQNQMNSADPDVTKTYFAKACKLGNSDGCEMVKELTAIDAKREAARRQPHGCTVFEHWNALGGYCEN